MAVKDHSLDEKIIRSAREIFLSQGFQTASIHKIAENAGVTTGALYTRYKSKDDLFCSLLREPVEELCRQEARIAELYYRVKSLKDLDLFLDALEQETRLYLDVIFQYYDQCVLLFCKSAGSTAEKNLKQGTEYKVKTTVEYLRRLSGKDLTGMEILIRQQSNLVKLILESSCSREEALKAMGLMLDFNKAGWKHLLEENMQ